MASRDCLASFIRWQPVADPRPLRVPPAFAAIEASTVAVGFPMASDPRTGSLLRTLAALKPAGRLLELGTGTGLGTSWLLDGMDRGSHLDSVDNDPAAVAIARQHLGGDPRLDLHVEDGGEYLAGLSGASFDLIFADTWPGKFTDLNATLDLVSAGGAYVVDDLLPQPNWPDGHQLKVDALLAAIHARPDYVATYLSWGTGILIASRGPAVRR